MTTFPELEAALDAAAHRHYGGRRRLPWRPLIPAAALALACAAALAVFPRSGLPPEASPAQAPGVSAETLALSRAHARAGRVPGRMPLDALLAGQRRVARAAGARPRA